MSELEKVLKDEAYQMAQEVAFYLNWVKGINGGVSYLVQKAGGNTTRSYERRGPIAKASLGMRARRR